ncbi:bile acid:sodium symporter family protein [Peribacillus asahii]|uniref:bile acid:sodium symporter family protein n=1 Tax=Peribacillus asahii TaxID=228899 RepID=UPI002079A2F6|nr:bile acid:sodium symporter family protein [Peribacillus asahii]USK71327.1 bile acid:sodium symporter family protein [Peribacillus asahii]
MFDKLNSILGRFLPIMIPSSLLIGIFIGDSMKEVKFLIPWIFAVMTFSGSLGSNFKQLTMALHNPFPIILVMMILHVIMPGIAWGIGHLLFAGDFDTMTGLILSVVIPTGITSFIWVVMYKGSVPVALSIILLDTLLSPIIVPLSLSVITVQQVEIDTYKLMTDLILMIVIPSVLAMCLNHMTKGRIQPILGAKLAVFSKLGIATIVMINGGIVSHYFREMNGKIVFIAGTVVIIAITGYFLSWITARAFKWNRDVAVSVAFTGGMRNISAGTVIASTYFPPKVVLPVVLGMLFQQVLASLCGKLIASYDKKQTKVSNSNYSEVIG